MALRLERLCDKRVSSRVPTPINWDCLECCVEKDSEAQSSFLGSKHSCEVAMFARAASEGSEVPVAHLYH